MLHRGVWPSLYRQGGATRVFDHDDVLKEQLGCGSDGKGSACNTGDPGSIPGSGRSPGEGNATRSSILAWEIP